MRTTPECRATGCAPVPARTWHTGSRTAEFTLNIEQTDGGDAWVHLWVGDPCDGVTVVLDGTQIDELITELMRRRALIATYRAPTTTRRAGSGRSD